MSEKDGSDQDDGLPRPEPDWKILEETDTTITYRFRMGGMRYERRTDLGREFGGRPAWSVAVVYDMNSGYQVAEAIVGSKKVR